jgi:hypothetical protein
METLKTKRFVVRKSLIGKNQLIEATFKNGKVATYNHDDAYNLMKDGLEKAACWEKYKSYTSSSSVPVIARPCIIEAV